MHNVSLKPVGAGSKNAPPPGGQLMLEGTVQTYRYLGDEEPKGDKASGKKGGK